MIDYLTSLFEYDDWATRRWLQRLRTIDDVDERTRRVFAHLPATRRVWIHRLRGEAWSHLAIWPELHWDACEALIRDNERAYRAYLDELPEDGLTASITYRNQSGTEYHTPVRDVLLHLLTHGHYHRGQIAAAVRQQGHEPVNTDYITYVRLPS